MEFFKDYSIAGIDVKAYMLIRKGLIYETIGGTNSVSNAHGSVVKIDDQWVAYEIGMLRMIQYSAKQDVKPIIVMTSSVAQGNAKGRSVLKGRMVFRNTNVGTLSDIKRRILTSDKFKIKIFGDGFGVDFDEEITADGIDESFEITNPEDIGWDKMPPVDILLVASDERDIELPRICRYKDVKIHDSGSSEGSTDTEENEFCNFTALSGHTPWRTLKRTN